MDSNVDWSMWTQWSPVSNGRSNSSETQVLVKVGDTNNKHLNRRGKIEIEE